MLTAITSGWTQACALTEGGIVKCWGSNSTSAVEVNGLGGGIISISTGSSHACAVTSDGGVKCWGNNSYGKLGNGTYTSSDTPVDVIGLDRGVKIVAAGGWMTCAVTNSGAVKCWGDNATGQLGNGSTGGGTIPVDVSGLSSGVTYITVGDSSACALTTGGAVKCWGYWRIPNPGTTTPEDVSGLSSGVVSISAGSSYHTCAVTTGGGAKCWGWNGNGELGDGTTTSSAIPVDVSGLSNGVKDIAAGGWVNGSQCHTCAVTTIGTVKCWGTNGNGQLGDGTTANSNVPVDVVFGQDGDITWRSRASLPYPRSMLGAAAVNGKVYSIGGLYRTRYLATNLVERYDPVLNTWDTVSSMPISINHPATTSTQAGKIYVIGGADQNAIANVQEYNPTTDTWRVRSPMPTARYFAGAAQASNGKIYVIGGTINVSGVSSISTVEEYDPATDIWTTRASMPTPRQALGVAAANGKIYAIGGGNYNGGYTYSSAVEEYDPETNTWRSRSPIPTARMHLRTVAINNKIYAISGFNGPWISETWLATVEEYNPVTDTWRSLTNLIIPRYLFGVAAFENKIYAIGGITSARVDTASVEEGTLLTTDICYSLLLATNPPTSGTPSASPAKSTTCSINGQYVAGEAITLSPETSTGYTFSNWTGATVTSNVLTMPAAATTVTANYIVSLIGKITVGYQHTCTLTTSGAVKCWGNNRYGQLGDGTTTDRYTPVDVSGLGSGVAVIAAGGFHTCALTTGGAVKCWGYNGDGNLGDGTTTERHNPVDVNGLSSGVQAIALGTGHTCALTTGGAVKCWGSNGYGSLGDGTTTDRYTPVTASGLGSGVQAIDDTCALTTGGAAKCWGYNWAGQVGDGTTDNRSIPVDVSGLGSGVSAISACRYGHNCALTAGGAVKCWGYNSNGQLGDGTITDRYTPVGVDGLGSGVQAIAAGAWHTCAQTTGGVLKCWGGNEYGQLGNGTTTNSTTPVDVVGLSPITYILSGKVTNRDGQGIGGISLSAGNWGNTVTDINGNYSFPLFAGTYTLTPTTTTYYYTPTGRTITLTSANVSNVNFTASNGWCGAASTQGSNLIGAGVCQWPPAKFLEIPFDYGNNQGVFKSILKKNVTSWFDHFYPDYKDKDNGGCGSGKCSLWLYYQEFTTNEKPLCSSTINSCIYGYGGHWYDGHDGIDFGIVQDVYPAAAGTIADFCKLGNNCGVWGNFVIVFHEAYGYYTRYAHLAYVADGIAKNVSVSRSTVLGKVGSTGASTAAHLHFGVYMDDGDQVWEPLADKPVDPYGWQKRQGNTDVEDPWGVSVGGKPSAWLWKYELSATQNLDAVQGGEVQDALNYNKAIIPANVGIGQVTLEISNDPAAVAGNNLYSIGRSFWLRLKELVTNDTPQSLNAPHLQSASNLAETLTQPVTLESTYTEESMRHLDVSQLKLYYYDETQNAWVSLPSIVDTDNHKVTAQSTELGAFDLQAPLLCPADTTEIDDNLYTAFTMEVNSLPLNRLFDIPEDEDWLHFTVQTGKTYIWQTQNLASGVDTTLDLIDSDGQTILASNDNGGGGYASKIVWQASKDRDVYLRVKPVSGSATGCQANYKLSFITNPSGTSLLSPSGRVILARPTFKWNAASGATHYYLWIKQGTVTKLLKLFTAAQTTCTAGTGQCSLLSPLNLTVGAYTWYIRTYNAVGYGPWSSVKSFTVDFKPLATTLVSPSGTILTTRPTFTWNAVPGTTYYTLLVKQGTRIILNKAYTKVQVKCALDTGRCTLLSPLVLTKRLTYTWQVQTRNAYGYGPWSLAKAFIIR